MISLSIGIGTRRAMTPPDFITSPQNQVFVIQTNPVKSLYPPNLSAFLRSCHHSSYKNILKFMYIRIRAGQYYCHFVISGNRIIDITNIFTYVSNIIKLCVIYHRTLPHNAEYYYSIEYTSEIYSENQLLNQQTFTNTQAYTTVITTFTYSIHVE